MAGPVMEGQQTQSSNIPGSQQQQATAAGGLDVISGLLEQAHKADAAAQQAAQLAAQPVAGAHQLPGSAMALGPAAHPRYELDTSPVIGHHNAQMRGLVNLGKGVSNLIGQVTQAQTQKKTQRLAVNIERLMGAVNSSDQAKQILANDPSNAAANDQLKKAQAIQDEILSDDKNRKDIAKAYNINFTDPSKNNTPEHAALKQATDSYAQQFQQKLPQQMGQDPQRVAAAQVAAAQSKATHDLIDKIAPTLIRQQTSFGVEATKAQTSKEIEAARDQERKEESQRRYNASVYTANEHYKAALGSANVHVAGMLKAVNEVDATKIKVAQMRIDEMDGTDPKSPATVRNAQRSFDSITKSLNFYQTQIHQLEINRKTADSRMKQNYDDQIRFYEAQGAVMQQKQAQLADVMTKAGFTPISTGETPSGDTGEPNATQPADTTTSSAAKPATGNTAQSKSGTANTQASASRSVPATAGKVQINLGELGLDTGNDTRP